MSPESKKLLSQFATALSNETIYGESDTASMKRWREYSAKTEAARKALEAHIESLEGAATAQAAPTDAQIISALHANGIDTYPSKYGFDAVQVSATSVPCLRKVLETFAAPPLSSEQQVKAPSEPEVRPCDMPACSGVSRETGSRPYCPEHRADFEEWRRERARKQQAEEGGKL
jgi:hypothetical protein